MKGTCSICGETIRSRRSQLNSARANFLKAVRKHMWTRHRTTMISRIKAGKRLAQENPSVQDMMSGLQSSVKEAIAIYRNMTERQYKHMKRVMDAIEPVLPPEIRASWKAIEAIHDGGLK